ncbi:hypothetical protein EDD22DRAFT_854920 [Suillus occidentalis]|nr:hypothetical protein EDD22DRAFT_854920 [Suillus occidentalis]
MSVNSIMSNWGAESIFLVEKLSKLDPNNIALKSFTIFCEKGKGDWVSDLSLEEVKELCQNFKPDVKCLLNCLKNPSKWALHVVNELPLFTYDRVVLIGDVSHAITPYLDTRAGQAIEEICMIFAHMGITMGQIEAMNKKRWKF